MSSDQSKIFEYNYKFWKFFGIWGGRKQSKYYKYYSICYLLTTFVCFNVLLTLNLIYTPRKLDLMLREVIFYFTEITIVSKVFTILFMRSKIIQALDLIDGDEFLGDYENKGGLLCKVHKNYKLCWRLYAGFSHVAFSQIFLPIIIAFIRGNELELPISKYYFLNEETRRSYFYVWFIYQSYGIYGHMMYNVNIDTFLVGLLVVAIAQLRQLNIRLRNLKLTEEENKLSKELQEQISITRLNSCLRQYDTILKFHNIIQEILSTTMFIQFSVASMIICVVMCGLLLLSSTARIFLILFLCVRTTQIFLLAFFGTQLAYESQELIFAAYNSDWIPRSETFKRSLRLFMERAKTPMLITCLKMFPLSLVTFTSIIKMAYSFFTLIRSFQEENN